MRFSMSIRGGVQPRKLKQLRHELTLMCEVHYQQSEWKEDVG